MYQFRSAWPHEMENQISIIKEIVLPWSHYIASYFTLQPVIATNRDLFCVNYRYNAVHINNHTL